MAHFKPFPAFLDLSEVAESCIFGHPHFTPFRFVTSGGPNQPPPRYWENFGSKNNFFENEKNVTEKNEFERFNQRNFLHFLGYSPK